MTRCRARDEREGARDERGIVGEVAREDDEIRTLRRERGLERLLEIAEPEARAEMEIAELKDAKALEIGMQSLVPHADDRHARRLLRRGEPARPRHGCEGGERRR